jgi:predicted membrane protein
MQNIGRLLFGVVLLVAGILFLLDLGDYVNATEIIGNWWPIVVIAFGLVSLIGPARSVIGGTIVIIVGVILLLATLDIIAVSAAELILPLILIAVGIGVLFVRSGMRAGADPYNTVSGFAVFGGQDIVSRSDAFKGGSLSALFGGVSLDLRQATIDPDGAGIDIFAAFGGIDVIVPRGWRVTVSGMPIFGAFEDSVDRSVEPEPDAPQVRVGGVVLFGGVDVKHEKD